METKTFSGSTDVDGHETYWSVINWEVDYPDRDEYFEKADWDMEITFTRKVKPIVIGQLVTESISGNQYKVIGVDNAKLWVRDSSGCGAYQTIDAWNVREYHG